MTVANPWILFTTVWRLNEICDEFHMVYIYWILIKIHSISSIIAFKKSSQCLPQSISRSVFSLHCWSEGERVACLRPPCKSAHKARLEAGSSQVTETQPSRPQLPWDPTSLCLKAANLDQSEQLTNHKQPASLRRQFLENKQPPDLLPPAWNKPWRRAAGHQRAHPPFQPSLKDDHIKVGLDSWLGSFHSSLERHREFPKKVGWDGWWMEAPGNVCERWWSSTRQHQESLNICPCLRH